MSSTAFTSATLRLRRPARIGKYFLTLSTINMGCAGPPRSRGSVTIASAASTTSLTVSSLRSSLDVHRLAQAVADQIEGNGGDEDGHARNGGDKRLHVDRLPKGREHQPPIR